MKAIGDRAQDLRNVLNAIANVSIPTDAYIELSNRAERAEQALARMYQTEQEMIAAGKDINASYKDAADKVDRLGERMKTLQAFIKDEESNLAYFQQIAATSRDPDTGEVVSTSRFAEAHTAIVETEKALEQCRAELAQVEKEFRIASAIKNDFVGDEDVYSPQFRALRSNIEAAEAELEKLHDQQVEMFMQGTDFVYGNETEEYAQMESALGEVTEAYHEAEEAKDEAFKPPHLQAWEQMPRLSRMIADAFNTIQDVGAGVMNAVTHPVQTLDRALGALVIRLGEVAARFARLAVQGAVNALHAIASAAKHAAESLLRMVTGAVHSGINKLQAGLRGLGSALKTVAGYAAQGAKAILGMNKSAHKSAGFDKGFKTIIRYAFGVRSTFFLVRRLRQALIDALGTIAKIDKPTNKALSSMSNALNQVKNSLGTAFQPIITAVAPYITKFLNLINDAITKIAEFFAILVGQDYIVKAKLYQQDYAKSLDKTTKSTKKATKAAKDQKNQLAAFDHLNILKANDKTNTGKTSVDPNKLFAKTPLKDIISGFFKNIKDAIDKEDWFKVGLLIADKLNQAFAKIQSYIKWENISKTITKYLDIVIGVFNGLIDPKRGLDFKLVGGTIAEGINSIVKSFEHLLDGINWANLGTGLGNGINGFVEKIDLNALAETLGKRVNAVTEVIYNAFTTIDWVGIGQKMVDGINTLIDTVKFDELGAALSEGIDGALELLTTAVTKFKWGEAGEKFADLILGLDMPGKWGQLANLLGISVNGVLDTIRGFVEKFDWGEEGKAFGEGVNKLVDTVDWPKLGRTLKAMVGVPISFLKGAVFSFKWGNAGTKFAQTVNGFFEDTAMWSDIGETINASIRGFLDFGQHFLDEFKPEQVATDIKTALGKIEWKEIASATWELAKTGFSKAGDFLSVLFGSEKWDIWDKKYVPDNKSLGKKIGDTIGKAIESIPWSGLATTLSDAAGFLFDNFTDAMGALFEKGENGKNRVVTAIEDFIGNIKWSELGDKLSEAAVTLFDGLKDSFMQLFALEDNGKSKVVNAIEDFFSGIKWGEIATSVYNFAKSAIITLGRDILQLLWDAITYSKPQSLSEIMDEFEDEGAGGAMAYVKGLIKTLTDESGHVKEEFNGLVGKLLSTQEDGTPYFLGTSTMNEFYTGFSAAVLDENWHVKEEFRSALQTILGEDNFNAYDSGFDITDTFFEAMLTAATSDEPEAVAAFNSVMAMISGGTVETMTAGGADTANAHMEAMVAEAQTQEGKTKEELLAIIQRMLNSGSTTAREEAKAAANGYLQEFINKFTTDGQVQEDVAGAVSAMFGTVDTTKLGSMDGTDFLKGLIQGMESEDENTAQKAVNIFNAILNKVKTDPDALDEHSPSKRAAKYGKDFIKGFGEGVEDNEDKTSSVVKGVFSNIADVSLAMSSMTYIVTTEMNNIKSIFMVRCYEFNKIVKDSFTTMGTDANTGMVAMKNTVVSSLSTMRSQALTAFNAIATTATTAVNNINTRVSSGFSSVRNNIVNNLRSARNSADNVGWASVGENIIYGINDGLHNGWNWLNKTVKNLARALLNSAKNALGIHSPSTLFRDEVGTMIGLGIGEGIEDSEPEILDAVVGVADAIADGMGMADAEIDLAVAGSDLLDGLDSVLVEFSARVSNSFAELVTALNDIANSANFRIPIAATGALTPYSVAGAVGDTTSVTDAIEASNDDLANVIMQVVNNATSAIVGAIQQSNHSSDSLSVNDIIDEINRRTRAQGRSPLLI